ncbi:MAG: rod shape-determining protein MreC [Gemmatimonadota bacterium]
MPPYAPEPEARGGRRQITLAVAFLLVSLASLYLPDAAQEEVAWALRGTILRPFVMTQERLAASHLRGHRVDELQAELDSMAAAMATFRATEDENRTLRTLLELKARVGPAFVSASVLRPGTPGSESMFLVDRGSDDGVAKGAPVVDRHGLVGVIREVRSTTSVGMDWTHPDFRASAMLADGTAYGVVENHRGAFRELDRLVLNGTAYYESVPTGMPVLTSGLGGVFPRGIPIGLIDGVAEAEGRWRKSYWLRPMVQPASVTHVLVAVGDPGGDVSGAWPTDSITTQDEAVFRERQHEDSLEALTDSVRLLRARIRELREADTVREGGR